MNKEFILSFHSRKTRLYILEKALEVLIKTETSKSGSASLCISILDVLVHLDDLDPYYSLMINFSGKSESSLILFPEIWKHRPTDHNKAYWFDKSDFKSRYDILYSAMNELRDQLNMEPIVKN